MNANQFSSIRHNFMHPSDLNHRTDINILPWHPDIHYRILPWHSSPKQGAQLSWIN